MLTDVAVGRLAADEARLVAAAHALAGERDNRLHPEVAATLAASGFARHLVPARWGGVAGTFTDLAAAMARVGEGCASAAWCAGVYAIAGRLGAHLPVEGQQDLWGEGPDVRMAACIVPAPGFRAEPAACGWRLSGAWPFASGVDHAEWVFVGAPVPGEPGPDDAAGGPPPYRFFAVPRRAVTVAGDWDNVGLAATGSATVRLDGAWVPEHRTFRYDDLLAGRAVGSAARCHGAPYKLVNGLLFVAPVLGAARGALAAWTAYVAAKREVTGQRTRDKVPVRVAVARSAAELDAAGFLLDRAARAADDGASGTEAELALVRSPRDFAVAAELVCAAVDRLLAAGGARGQARTNVVQRAWRDAHAAAGHVVLQLDSVAGPYAEHVFDRA
ncbi:MAG TPA: acyl-CoA dehydrogenase family protein [Mycobacteriales bacterium]|nr:acyl-CoA dehydrogenase family protein [Mycobacteriales bacterium]